VDLLTRSRERFPKERKIELFIGLLNHYRIKNSMQANYAIRRMVSLH
jgi:hypothetical protein